VWVRLQPVCLVVAWYGFAVAAHPVVRAASSCPATTARSNGTIETKKNLVSATTKINSTHLAGAPSAARLHPDGAARPAPISRPAHAVGSKAVVRIEVAVSPRPVAWAALWNSPCASRLSAAASHPSRSPPAPPASPLLPPPVAPLLPPQPLPSACLLPIRRAAARNGALPAAHAASHPHGPMAQTARPDRVWPNAHRRGAQVATAPVAQTSRHA
jgi:hypothetical protein